ncbi:MAG TPA: hypothetical protein VM821_01635, partial [Abditibacteriaceae bacterium]|nr:hypothetical protein [Abditibacteriaceae bacterium]
MKALRLFFRNFLANVLLLLLLFFGTGALLAGRSYSKLHNTPRQTSAQIAALPDRTSVRLEGQLKAASPSRDVGGQLVAVQKLLVERIEGRFVGPRFSSTRRQLYLQGTTSPLVLEDETSRIAIEMPPSWRGSAIFLPAVEGVVGDDEQMPPQVKPQLSRSLKNLPALQSGQTWTLWTLAQGARVTLYGQVLHRNGQVVVGNIKGQPFALSTGSFAQAAQGANQIGWSLQFLGVFCLGIVAWCWSRGLRQWWILRQLPRSLR